MAKLNAAWGIIGERIAALPSEDAALLTHLLDNSGTLGILEGLGQIDLSASKVVAEDRYLKHHLLFRTDVASALLGYAGDATMVLTIAAAVAPEPFLTKGGTTILGAISTIASMFKAVIDGIVPTDLQSLEVEIERNLGAGWGHVRYDVLRGLFP